MRKSTINRNAKGVTLVALVVTIIVLLILSGIVVSLTVGNNGLFGRSEKATQEHIKQEAKEAMNMKITSIQIESYTENEKLPDLQYLADKLCEDNEMEYVIKKEKKQANLNKIDVSDVNSIFTKIRKYPYEFEINNELQLASIDGVKIADTNNDLKTSIDELKLAIATLQEENKELKNRLTTLENETIVNKRINLMNNITEIPIEAKTSKIVDVDITLSDSIEDYKYLEIQVDLIRNKAETGAIVTDNSLFEQTIFIAREQINYHNSNTVSWNNGSCINLTINAMNPSNAIGVILHSWFKDAKTMHVGMSCGGQADWTKMRIKRIYGIK